MGIINDTVIVRIGRANIKHYKELGYNNIKIGDEIEVNIQHVPKHSEVEVLVECDFCKENKMYVPYDRYNKAMDKSGSYACKKCSPIKTRQTVQQRYNVEHIAHLDFVKNKKRETCLERYNAECAMQNVDIQKGIRKVMLEKYGVEHSSQSPEIKAKMAQTAYKNGTMPTSRQQRYIFYLYKTTNKFIELNYPISRFNVDICFTKEKLNVEVDFGGHNLAVKMGYETQEEFDQKEIVRNNIIRREGYKTMRIVSRKDLLPQDTILFQILSEARHYFQTTSHTWQTYDIDKSLLFNAEHKDGVYYDFGTLRTVKNSDLDTIKDGNLSAIKSVTEAEIA